MKRNIGIVLATAMLGLMLTAQIGANTAWATSPAESVKTSGKRITLADLGLLQVAAHDLYNVNRTSGQDIEDERLNLSTLFSYGEENIANGGEKRNSENIVTHTVAVNIANYYFSQVAKTGNELQARETTVNHYLDMLAGAYERTFGEEFPQPLTGDDEEEEGNRLNGDLALRTLHAFLPSQIVVNGKTVAILDPTIVDVHMSSKELRQLSRPLDDSFDPAFLHMQVGVDQNGNPIFISLLERDQSFGTEFNTDYTFNELLAELSDGKYSKNDIVMKLIRSEFAEGQTEE